MATRRQGLARRRKSLGLTQEDLAHHVGVQRSTVVRWERGETEPQPLMCAKLARVLKISAAHLDGLLAEVCMDLPHAALSVVRVDHEPAVAEIARLDAAAVDDMNRRALLRLFSMIGTTLALPGSLDVDRLADDRLDAEVLDEYTELNGHLWRVFALSAVKADALPAVRTQLAVLVGGLARSLSPVVRQRLTGLTADLLQLAGEIFFDGNRYTDAAHCYTLAASASKEASAYDLWACSMIRHAFVAVYDRQFEQAEPMLELAATLARQGDSTLSTRHWVHVVQAETCAGLGDLTACQRALDAAEDVRQLDGPVHNGGWLRFDGSRLAEERGTCYITLGQPDLAETALTAALREDLTPRRRASVLTDLAVVGAQRRNPDQIITYAEAAIAEGRHTGSGVISHKLAVLQPYLVPMLGNKQIHNVHREIDALTAAG